MEELDKLQEELRTIVPIVAPILGKSPDGLKQEAILAIHEGRLPEFLAEVNKGVREHLEGLQGEGGNVLNASLKDLAKLGDAVTPAAIISFFEGRLRATGPPEPEDAA